MSIAYHRFREKYIHYQDVAKDPEHPDHEQAQKWIEYADKMLHAFWYGKEATDA